MLSLDQLGIKYGTDKSSQTHNYLHNYARYFDSWRYKEFVLWEIGVAEKRSINMWREYFPKAKVYGIDINPDCAGEGIFIGSQSDTGFIVNLVSKTGYPDIIIDDGSHMGHDIKSTFKALFSLVNKGGYYVIEDTHCFYCDHYAQDSGIFEYLTGKCKDVDVAGRGMTGNTETAINWHDNNPPLPEMSKYLSCMHIHPSVWFFERK